MDDEGANWSTKSLVSERFPTPIAVWMSVLSELSALAQVQMEW